MSRLLDALKAERKQLLLILLFFLVNFGLWEVIAPLVSNEWASFIVYVVLFVLTLGLFNPELRDEWKSFTRNQLRNKAFFVHLAIWFAANLLLGAFLIYSMQNFNINILPENSENVKEQISSIPIVLAVVQGCLFAPVIEESVFRYAMIGKEAEGRILFLRVIISIIVFDAIHIVRFPEFFYYLLPSLALTTFYLKHRNVFASILLHSLINIVGYVLLILELRC